MSNLISISEIATICGVTTGTIRNWEESHLIPQGYRRGLQRKRVWSRQQVEQILEFAEGNGYQIRPLSGALSEGGRQ